MSTYRLDQLFRPRSVAVVGASPRETSPGHAVLRNLRRGGFRGRISLVNPHYDSIEEFAAVKSYEELPAPPDLAVIAVPPPAVQPPWPKPRAKGTPAGIIITAGLGHGPGSLADAQNTRAPRGCALSAPIVSAFWYRPPSSMPALPLPCRAAATWR